MLQVVGEQLSKSAVTDRAHGGSLMNVNIRPPIAFNQRGSILRQCNVPADQSMVIEGTVSLDHQINSFLPEWKLPPVDCRARKRVTVMPDCSVSGFEARCQTEFSSSHVDR
jgi:hypothetical protein